MAETVTVRIFLASPSADTLEARARVAQVVAEIAAEACEGDTAAQAALIDWLAVDHPGVAVDLWNHAGRLVLSPDLLARTAAHWCPRLTDVHIEPAPEARAAIGRWLGALDLSAKLGVAVTLPTEAQR